MKRRTIKAVHIFLCIIICLMIFCGCSNNETPKDYIVEEVKCMVMYGDRDGAEIDIYKADGPVKQYIIVPYSDSGIDFYADDIPSDNNIDVKEYSISEDEWNSIADVIKSNDFMSLPEELPEVEAYDGATCYIEIKTSEGNHVSGGYCAGNGTGKEHQRFYNIRRTLKDVIQK